ncbi:SOS response-associated peptidase family protein [Povalibacter sp.]|uniref:SOS response-associated peptidase family protein n=1 Tax=Povalibacter sp. TaxID=1962978 RepID=UPI002F413FAF
MCYSANVLQSLNDYLREQGARPDYAQIEGVFRQRVADRNVRIPRGFERNFDDPVNAEQQRIRLLIDQHRQAQITRFEQEAFAQKRRLADAQRRLQVKETKSARNEQRIATGKIDGALQKLSLLKGTQPHPEDARIFPLTHGPIIVRENGCNIVRLARYHLRQRGAAASVDRQFPGLYNARRDNLEKFWRNEFGRTHALMVVDSFFENVEREGRNVVLHFIPRPAQRMLVACMFGEWRDPRGDTLLSFAAITDEPPAEVRAAGHDRVIVNLQLDNVERWLTPNARPKHELQDILSERQAPYYEHRVEAA